MVLHGEAGTGKSEVALNSLITALQSNPADVGVVCTVGLSRRVAGDVVNRLSAAGLAQRVTVVCASGSPPQPCPVPYSL